MIRYECCFRIPRIVVKWFFNSSY